MASSSGKVCISMMLVFVVLTSNSVLYVSAKVALYTNQSLRAGDQLSNRGFTLAMQGDCNLVLYDHSNAIWSTGTAGKGNNCYVTMQGDGNLVIYGDRGVVWASNTVRGIDRYELIVQEDRNVVIYKGPARRSIWDTKTYFHA